MLVNKRPRSNSPLGDGHAIVFELYTMETGTLLIFYAFGNSERVRQIPKERGHVSYTENI